MLTACFCLPPLCAIAVRTAYERRTLRLHEAGKGAVNGYSYAAEAASLEGPLSEWRVCCNLVVAGRVRGVMPSVCSRTAGAAITGSLVREW
jgi:hypothetical protein